MALQKLYKTLSTSNGFFEFNQGEADVSDGWKLSIQGKTINDALFLYEKLKGLLFSTKCSFKIGTQKLIDKKHPQQSTKLLTIYVPNGVDAKSFAELVYLNILDYKGGQNINCPESYEHYANAIYFRNDRDQNGNYIKAN
jgi:hypothetical protein